MEDYTSYMGNFQAERHTMQVPGTAEIMPEVPVDESSIERLYKIILEPDLLPESLRDSLFIYTRHLALTKLTNEGHYLALLDQFHDIIRLYEICNKPLSPELKAQLEFLIELHLSKSKDYGSSPRERVELNSMHSHSTQEMEGQKAPEHSGGLVAGIQGWFGGNK